MNKGINVLSLFDGISCGQVALERANIKVNKYFASEIDKTAIKITQENYPNTIQLGDVRNIDVSKLPEIDLIIGGSPCTNLSLEGKMDGLIANGLEHYKFLKKSNNDFGNNQSYLFWEYIRILNEVKPKYFLLENVKPKKDFINIISSVIGVEPIEIDSSDFSSQTRKRLYWTNIEVDDYKTKEISIKDILGEGCEENSVEKILSNFEKENCDIKDNILTVKINNRKPLIVDLNDKAPYSFCESRSEYGKMMRRKIRKETGRDSTPRNSMSKIIKKRKLDKFNCVLTGFNKLDYFLDNNCCYRTYTKDELHKLQTLPSKYIPDEYTLRTVKRMIGNGWTVDVIAHIFKNIK